MNNKEADRICLETGALPIEFDVEGVFVFFVPNRTDGIAIAGIDGSAFFDRDGAIKAEKELRYYTDLKKFTLKGKVGETRLSGKHAAALAESLADIAELYLKREVI